MSDTKPCRWVRVIREGEWFDCGHPIMDHHCMGRSDEEQEGLCHGCPCHEPADGGNCPETPNSSNACQWSEDGHGNWFTKCRDTMAAFTPWRGVKPTGCFCPYCSLPIAVVPTPDPEAPRRHLP